MLSRRAVLKAGVLTVAAPVLPALGSPPGGDAGAAATVGLLTDVHYADKPALGSRHYRHSIAKVRIAAKEFRRARVDCLVELGDLIDRAESVEEEVRWLGAIESELSIACDERHYVMGNHCLATLTRQEFAAHTAAREERSYYGFDRGGFRFVVLDACYTTAGVPYARGNFQVRDTALPPEEIDWLANDLRGSEHPCIVGRTMNPTRSRMPPPSGACWSTPARCSPCSKATPTTTTTARSPGYPIACYGPSLRARALTPTATRSCGSVTTARSALVASPCRPATPSSSRARSHGANCSGADNESIREARVEKNTRPVARLPEN